MTQDRGAFLESLGWLDRLSGPLKNTLRGNLGGAGRQVVDLLGDLVDAPLPGDWIPHIAKPEDEVTPSELIGLDRKEHPWLAGATDFVGDVALNPATYLPIPTTVLKGYGKLAAKGAEMLPEAAQPAVASVKKAGSDLAQYARKVAGAQDVTDAVDEGLRDAGGTASIFARSGAAALKTIFKGSSKSARTKAFQVINNSRKVGDEFVPFAEGTEAANPLRELIKTDDGLPLSDIPRSQPAEDYLKIKEAGAKRGKIAPVDSDVGIEGVTSPKLQGDVLEQVTKDPARMQDQVFNPMFADRAAGETLEQAYPLLPTDPRFKSGIENYNENFVAGIGKGKTYGPDALKPSPSELGAPEAPLLKDGKLLTGLDAITGAKMPRAKVPSAEVPDSVVNSVNESLGGVKSTTKTVRGEDIPSEHGTFSTVESNLARWQKRIDASGWTDAEKKEVSDLLAKWAPYQQAQYTESVKVGGLTAPQGIDPVLYSPADYAHRNFSGLRAEKEADAAFGNASSFKERTLKDKESLNAFRNANKDVTLEEDLGTAAGRRLGQQARMGERASLADTFVGKFAKQFEEKSAPATSPYDVPAPKPSAAEELAKQAMHLPLNDPKTKEAMNAIIQHIGLTHPEDAQVLGTRWNGLKPMGPFLDTLTKLTKPFKAAAVYGYVLPRFDSLFSNRLSGIAQTFATSSAEGTTKGMVTRLPQDVLGALNDSVIESFGARRMTKDVMSKEFDAASKAFTESGGVAEDAMSKLPARMKLAFQHGVLDNTFVNTEDMLRVIDSSGIGRKFKQAAHWPAEIQQGLEQRMRYGMFGDLLDGGMEVRQAAKETEKALYSYRMSSDENRLARTYIPFFQFQAKAVPQTAKALLERPYLATALGSAYSQNKDQPVYPWMQGKLNVPLGQDADGNSQYLTGFRLPFESLASIPNPSANSGDFGRQVEQGVVASANPLMKSAYGVVSGRDPYFGNDYGSYDNIAGLGKAGDLGRFYNKAAQAGAIQPLDSALRTVGGLLDDRHSVPVRALDALTGFHFASVDPDLALRQQLGQEIERNPNIQHSTTPYSKSADPDTVALLHEYRDAQKAVRDKRRGQLIP